MRLRPAYEIQVLVMSSNRPHGGPPKQLRRKLFVCGVIVEPDGAMNSQLPIYVAPLPKLDIGFALKTSASKIFGPARKRHRCQFQLWPFSTDCGLLGFCANIPKTSNA